MKFREHADEVRCRFRERDALGEPVTEYAAFFRLMLYLRWGGMRRGTASTHQPTAGTFTETRRR